MQSFANVCEFFTSKKESFENFRLIEDYDKPMNESRKEHLYLKETENYRKKWMKILPKMYYQKWKKVGKKRVETVLKPRQKYYLEFSAFLSNMFLNRVISPENFVFFSRFCLKNENTLRELTRSINIFVPIGV